LFLGRTGFGIAFRIEQYDFDSRKALPNGVAQLLGVQVRQTAIEKEHLPETALQMDQSFGSPTNLFETAGGGMQTFEDALAYHVAGAGHQDVVSIVVRDRETRHTIDLKRILLERD
jgi:hypothetical protein